MLGTPTLPRAAPHHEAQSLEQLRDRLGMRTRWRTTALRYLSPYTPILSPHSLYSAARAVLTRWTAFTFPDLGQEAQGSTPCFPWEFQSRPSPAVSSQLWRISFETILMAQLRVYLPRWHLSFEGPRQSGRASPSLRSQQLNLMILKQQQPKPSM